MRLSWVFFVPVACSGIACGAAPVPAPSAPERPKIEPAPEPQPVETLDDLVRTINDDPGPRHFSQTPSVDKLIERGDAAIPRMLDLMLSDDWPTRLRAQRVLEGVTWKHHGFVFGQGWSDPKGNERFQAFWKSLGDLDCEAPREDREKAAKLWRTWLASRKG